jgi:hypothetical protein
MMCLECIDRYKEEMFEASIETQDSYDFEAKYLCVTADYTYIEDEEWPHEGRRDERNKEIPTYGMIKDSLRLEEGNANFEEEMRFIKEWLAKHKVDEYCTKVENMVQLNGHTRMSNNSGIVEEIEDRKRKPRKSIGDGKYLDIVQADLDVQLKVLEEWLVNSNMD